ncbi:MAG: permease [Gemmatimonadetes bacterium]|nr:permease [Gemmatimonadota bacterium]
MTRHVFQFPWRSRIDIRRDVDEELRFHLESREQELMAGGSSAEAARTLALREFGDVDDARACLQHIDDTIETTRRRRDYMNDLIQDLKYSVRALRATPTFTIVAVLTLALGIGANTAVFSVVHGVLQQPLPFPHPEQLVKIWSVNPTAGMLKGQVSPIDLDDWRAQRSRMADMGGWYFTDGGTGMDVTGLGEPQRVSTAFVMPGFFSTLQATPLVGRLPREDEMVRGGPDKVVVLSYGYWQRNFGGADSIVGKTLTLNGGPFRVLGVMRRDFAFPSPRTEMFVPYSTFPDRAVPHIRPVRTADVVARMKPGTTIDQVRAELAVITKNLAAQYPDDAAWTGATVVPLHEAMTGSVQTALLVLLAAVTFVLLMACVNVASLQLARATAREREIAIRVSIGATAGRIIRQLITESLVLALAGGIAGCAVALVGTRTLIALSAGQLPRVEEIHVDVVVMLFVLGVSLVSGLVFGLAPALRASSVDIQGMLRASSRSSTSTGGRLRNALVIAQLAFAVVLAVGAGLMTRSFRELLNVDPGFKPDHLLAVNFSINTTRHGDTAWQNYYNNVIQRVRLVPGVVAAGAAQYAPFRGMGERNPFVPVSYEVKAGEEVPAFPTQRISDGYFATIGTRVLSGREFLPADRAGTPTVVIVNEAYARKFFPGQDPVGKQLRSFDAVPITIVGMVGNIRQSDVSVPSEPLVYVNNMQNGRVKVTLVSRTRDNPLTMANSIRDAIWSVDRDQPITSIFTFDDIMNETLAKPRLMTVLFGAFGTIGLVLGAIGIYGVLAFLVTQRRREIGLRIALGATERGVMMLVVRRALSLAASGVTIGIVIALVLSRFVGALLYGVTPTDPSTYLAVIAALAAVAGLASFIPARRAAGVSPLVAMRQE